MYEAVSYVRTYEHAGRGADDRGGGLAGLTTRQQASKQATPRRHRRADNSLANPLRRWWCPRTCKQQQRQMWLLMIRIPCCQRADKRPTDRVDRPTNTLSEGGCGHLADSPGGPPSFPASSRWRLPLLVARVRRGAWSVGCRLCRAVGFHQSKSDDSGRQREWAFLSLDRAHGGPGVDVGEDPVACMRVALSSSSSASSSSSS